MKKLSFVAVALATAISSQAFAEVSSEDQVKVKEPTKIGWSAGFALGSVSEDAQWENGVGDSFWGLTLGANWDIKSNWNFELGMSIYNFEDENEFSQYTQDYFGDVSNSTSDVVGIGGYGEFGYLKKLGEKKNYNLGANLGYEFLGVDREIGSCVDCYSEDVDIESGLYLRPFASVKVGQRTDLEVSYKQPLSSDDLEGVFQVGFTFTP